MAFSHPEYENGSLPRRRSVCMAASRALPLASFPFDFYERGYSMNAIELTSRRRLRTVAFIDIFKGLAILAIGLGILNADSHVLENGGLLLLQVLDLDPTHSTASKFLALLHAADSEHGLLTLAALAYASLRFIEAYGLWRTRNWARWLGLISTSIYVPFEIYYLIKGPGWTTFSVLMINLLVLWLLWPRRKQNPGILPMARTA